MIVRVLMRLNSDTTHPPTYVREAHRWAPLVWSGEVDEAQLAMLAADPAVGHYSVKRPSAEPPDAAQS